jgi:triphosphatase
LRSEAAIATETGLTLAARPDDLLASEQAAATRPQNGAAAVHAEPVELDPELTGDAALQRIGLACLDHVSSNKPAVLAGVEDGIHQMRVGVRRLRATLSAFGKLLPDNQRHWASEELRWLADALGPARNLDVFETGLLQPAKQDVADRAALEQLRQVTRRRRRVARHDAAEAVESMRYTVLMQCLRRWFDNCGWRERGHGEDLYRPIDGVAERVLQRRWRVAKKRGKGFATQSPDERHRLRIALKKLRYTTESLASLYSPEKTDLFVRGLKRLQDDLGHANDLRVAHEILAELAPRAGPIAEAGRQVLGWHEERLDKNEPKLRNHLHELFATEPFWRD